MYTTSYLHIILSFLKPGLLPNLILCMDVETERERDHSQCLHVSVFVQILCKSAEKPGSFALVWMFVRHILQSCGVAQQKISFVRNWPLLIRKDSVRIGL